ncbi:murein hydrolase activator EnvC family protein [Ornithinibacillus bavariensis]|nr:peptidoglycan DD-metalloendopeptidase family protein [Ornithinibacillus bavariensis]
MRKKLGISMLIGLIILGSVPVNGIHVSAKTKEEYEQELKDLEKEQLQLKEQNKDIQSSKSETEGKIEENLDKQASVQSQIDSLDEKLAETKASIQSKQGEIDTTNNEINDLKAKINALKKEIEQLKEEIEILLDRIEDREALLAERLRAIQKSGGPMVYLQVLLGSTSFSDFITRTAAVNIMMDQDKTIIDSLVRDKKEVETKKQTVEGNKKKVEENKDQVEKKKIALEGQKQELLALQGQLDNQMAERQTLLAKLEKEHQHLEEYMFTLEDEQAMLRAQQQAVAKAKEVAKQKLDQLSNSSGNNGNAGGTSSTGFIWPAAGYRASNYGWRVDPINNSKSFHLGVDISGPVGTPIYAATNGVAVRGNLSSTYGNHILIVTTINGVDYTTLYAHMSGFAVADGTVVKQGQLIGYMGATGRVTGPHLHFEVHKGGWNGFYPPNSNVVNPLDYLP